MAATMNVMKASVVSRSSVSAAVVPVDRVVVRQACRNAFAGSRRCVAAQASVLEVAPVKEQQWKATHHTAEHSGRTSGLPQLISREQVQALEAELDTGASVAALRRFNANLRSLPADRWEAVLGPVFLELCFNLESFNPAFTSCLLMIQQTIGRTDYVRRDVALKNLIQPLAGEYGMHNDMPQLKTHRELFSDFYQSLFGHSLAELIAQGGQPIAAEVMFAAMMRDILGGGGGAVTDTVEKASYAMGYNLAIEYLADYEKTWMLDSFRDVDRRLFAGLGKKVDWVFLKVHAEGEAEHAVIGHNAVLSLVPSAHVAILRTAMKDHDRDMATFYNRMADMLAL